MNVEITSGSTLPEIFIKMIDYNVYYTWGVDYNCACIPNIIESHNFSIKMQPIDSVPD
jgi:hypothetical protein